MLLETCSLEATARIFMRQAGVGMGGGWEFFGVLGQLRGRDSEGASRQVDLAVAEGQFYCS